VAQVVAAGGIIGGGALGVAVIVKLARALMQAPIVSILIVRQRRPGHATPDRETPPLVPLVIIGFLLMVILLLTLPMPTPILDIGHLLQTALLSAAMFGLGCGVKIRNLVQVGARPFVLAAGSTVMVAGIALAGVQISSLLA